MTSGPGRPLKGWTHHGEEPSGFARLDAEAFPSSSPEPVWLVGAGPGAPGLLIAARLPRACSRADVVVYDALVNADILRWVRPGAELEYAGKRGGKPSPQPARHLGAADRACPRRQARAAAQGRRPLHVRTRRRGVPACSPGPGVPFRIVPGITAGIGGLAYAGIPATHRDTNHSVIFLTGHDATGTHAGQCRLAGAGHAPRRSSSCTWR